MSLILLHITSFVYIILLAIFYFRKTRLSDVENKIYKNLLLSNILGLLIEFCCFYGVANIEKMEFFTLVVTRLLLLYYLFFISLYTVYVFVLCCMLNIFTIAFSIIYCGLSYIMTRRERYASV